MRIVSGSNITDSVEAVLSPLVVEVRDGSGRVAPTATLVRFSTVAGSWVSFTAAGPLLAYDALAVATDSAGRASIRVQLGQRPGAVKVLVEALALNVRDTARFVVIPGQPASLTLSPRDTALFVGRDYTLRASVSDRLGNLRTDSVAWTASRSGVSVTAAGRVASTTTGRYEVIARSMGFVDTAKVSALPLARLAAWSDAGQAIVEIGLDGSDRRIRTNVRSAGKSPRPQWLPGSERIVYSHYSDEGQELRVAEVSGGSTLFLPSRPASMWHLADASPSLRGPWVYFAAVDTSQCPPSNRGYCVHRARADGTGLESLGAAASPTLDSSLPSSSPDGSRVAFVTWVNRARAIRVLDVTTRNLSSWHVVGEYPQWSPLGDRIAYLDSTRVPHVVNADGTGGRAIARLPSTFYSNGHFSWSPDGEWIVLGYGWEQYLVRVANGEILPLPHLNGLRDFAWR